MSEVEVLLLLLREAVDLLRQATANSLDPDDRAEWTYKRDRVVLEAGKVMR